ncbi:hypothetical protein ACFP9V_06600 [Deinococcus radiopugnans]|uniref:Uncharacterized protein n=1 Tax=Deinococcus radiopugnans ATCC 19172 TaxID=585398 RepID=A0A5C4Y533_9DEIO|nr:hypothetical protein [Deinococcus radiopugnans]MBB6017348.1 hypothetical protein [Deinococcus radiopugnans ATCC 19172]TNM70097.1 hypothetical protein FHR04_14010 [Deinococcus radiopugnans ATCC 19172]
MSFVRKPRPYSSGLPSVGLPQAARETARPEQKKGPRPRRVRGPRPAMSWAGAVTGLAVLGTALVILVGASGLWNSVARDWQFRSAAAGVTDVAR